jgi:GTP 3',8-cyclase
MVLPTAADAGSTESLLTDPTGRRLDYLRLAVTDRCNLRCCYCMPETGVEAVHHRDILTFEEAWRLCALFCALGVRKIRVTGGEPLVRRGTVEFIGRLAQIAPRPEVLLTSNGVLLAENLDALVAAGLRRVNLSLDSLDPRTWRTITRREGFASARAAIDAVLARGLGLKINMVVLAGINDGELLDFAELARARPVEVRFIEAMPFDGRGGRPGLRLAGPDILARLRTRLDLAPLDAADQGVARLYRSPGFAGRLGLIEGHTRSFCAACSRLRLDAQGRFRTCLYGQPAADLKTMLREGGSDAELAAAVRAAIASRAPDGHVAEGCATAAGLGSMASIGG